MSEPRRLIGRYAHDLWVFGPALARQMWTGRRHRHGGALLVDGDPGTAGPCTVELAGLRRLDNSSAAQVVALRRTAHLAGGTTAVVGASPAVLADASRLDVASFVAADETRPGAGR
jgi:hypothetical protein